MLHLWYYAMSDIDSLSQAASGIQNQSTPYIIIYIYMYINTQRLKLHGHFPLLGASTKLNARSWKSVEVNQSGYIVVHAKLSAVKKLPKKVCTVNGSKWNGIAWNT